MIESETKSEPRLYKEMAYSFKDVARQELQYRKKLLRIIREQEKRIFDLEKKMNTVLETIHDQSQRGK